MRCLRRASALPAPLLAASCGLAGPAIPGGLANCEPTRAQQMVDLLNHMREEEGLFPLQVDRRLIGAAQTHTKDMAYNGFVGHDGSDGSLTAYRVDQERYPWHFVSENTSGGFSSASATFAAWEASPSHHRNNIDPSAEHIGVGYAENGATAFRTNWLVVLGASPEAPLTPPGGCHP